MNIERLKEAHDLSLDGRDFAARQIILDVIADLEKKETAEQPAQQQDPVAVVSIEHFRGQKSMENVDFQLMTDLSPGEHLLYTTPPQRKPLTDEEINRIAKNYALSNPTTPLHFARAIEAAHDIKENT